MTIKEAELFIPDPVVLLELTLILAGHDSTKLVHVDSAGGGWDNSTDLVAVVADWELQSEDLRVAIKALLLIHSVTIAVQIRIDKIFSEQTKQDSHCLVDVVHSLAIGVIDSDEHFLDRRWASKDILRDSRRFEESVDEVPG